MSRGQSIAHQADTGHAGASEAWSTLDRFQNFIDQTPGLAFLLLSVLYILTVVSLSYLKLLWLDELITLHIARLGSAAAIWHALSQGADPNPPVTHLLVNLCRNLFGEREIALRLPAIVGYWIGLASIFAYLLRRLPATWALAGTVMLMCMAAFDYSYESRSYGIFYGLTMLAFLMWTRSIHPTYGDGRRGLTLAAMTLTLAACISTNYFAVLAFLPIAAGEFARTVIRFRKRGWPKAIDAPVWICLLLGASPLIVYRPLIAHSIAEFAPHAWNKVSLSQVSDSYTQMVEIILYPILALFLISGLAYLFRWQVADLGLSCRKQIKPGWLGSFLSQATERLPIPLDEAVGVVFLMAYPILGYIVASIHGGMLSPRFVIPVCFGFAISATVAAFMLVGRKPRAGLYLLLFCTAWFVYRESFVGYWYSEQKECFYKVVDHLPEALRLVPPNAPIAIPDPLLALTFQHYAPKALAQRVVFPIDFPALRKYRGDDSPEQNLWAGRNSIYTLPVMTMAHFQNSVGAYLIIASDGNWFLNDLNDHHYEVVRLPINTRAGAIGGFTPLARGTPVFYLAAGDRGPESDAKFDEIRFREEDNLPNAGSSPVASNDQRAP